MARLKSGTTNHGRFIAASVSPVVFASMHDLRPRSSEDVAFWAAGKAVTLQLRSWPLNDPCATRAWLPPADPAHLFLLGARGLGDGKGELDARLAFANGRQS